jgi:hypothetical protein
MIGGTLLALASASVWIIASVHWAQIEPGDPRKALANDVLTTFKKKLRNRASTDSAKANHEPDSYSGPFD